MYLSGSQLIGLAAKSANTAISIIIKSNYMAKVLSDIRGEINSVYTDLAKADLVSAEQAFRAIENSRNKESELRSAIGKLRDSYNKCQQLLNKKEKRVSGYFFWKEEYFVDTIISFDRAEIYIRMAEISCIIAITYNILYEESNKRYWVNKSKNCCYSYKHIILRDYTPKKLFLETAKNAYSSSEYVTLTHEFIGGNEAVGSMYSDVHTFTQKGKSYINNIINKRTNVIKKLLP